MAQLTSPVGFTENQRKVIVKKLYSLWQSQLVANQYQSSLASVNFIWGGNLPRSKLHFLASLGVVMGLISG